MARVRAMLARAGLDPKQAAIVAGVFVVTATGAAALIWYFRRKNKRNAK